MHRLKLLASAQGWDQEKRTHTTHVGILLLLYLAASLSSNVPYPQHVPQIACMALLLTTNCYVH
jgi:hypothetical protein